ncbi:hypothetical protein L0156_10410 [bacterium]|nr:hypothetical protein [bacterium]
MAPEEVSPTLGLGKKESASLEVTLRSRYVVKCAIENNCERINVKIQINPTGITFLAAKKWTDAAGKPK